MELYCMQQSVIDVVDSIWFAMTDEKNFTM